MEKSDWYMCKYMELKKAIMQHMNINWRLRLLFCSNYTYGCLRPL